MPHQDGLVCRCHGRVGDSNLHLCLARHGAHGGVHGSVHDLVFSFLRNRLLVLLYRRRCGSLAEWNDELVSRSLSCRIYIMFAAGIWYHETENLSYDAEGIHVGSPAEGSFCGS